MRRRPLGKTGLSVSELALGTWGLSGDGYGPVPESEQEKVIDRARALGITLFETADSYAGGAMERRLGERLKGDESARFVTKLGTDRDASVPRKRFDAAYLREAFERSRERLGREVVDVVLLHNPSTEAIAKGEACELLAELVSAGKLRAWGVSAGDAEVARAGIAKGAGVISIAYNVFATSDLGALISDIEQNDVGVLAHSALSYGLLCGHWSGDKVFPEGDHRAERWTPDELRTRVRQLDALRPTVGGPILTMRAAALRFALQSRKVSAVVLGPKSSLQLDQLVREAGKGPPYLEDWVLVALRNRLRDVGVDA
ncbi:MAG: aldo/keto reductase [Myxococcales bacterium]|nr:aldo/keto reductase [Myxococcales bacterium]